LYLCHSGCLSLPANLLPGRQSADCATGLDGYFRSSLCRSAAWFNHLWPHGDRIGRKATLIGALLTMGIATFVIGLLPTYFTIGLWAPALLTIMRFCQGLGLGG